MSPFLLLNDWYRANPPAAWGRLRPVRVRRRERVLTATTGQTARSDNYPHTGRSGTLLDREAPVNPGTSTPARPPESVARCAKDRRRGLLSATSALGHAAGSHVR